MSNLVAYKDETEGPIPVSQQNPLPVMLADAMGPQSAALSQSVVPAVDAAFTLKVMPPSLAAQFAPNNATSIIYESSRAVKMTSGVVYGAAVFNSKNAIQYIQFFDATALPADGAVPVCIPVPVQPLSTVSIDFGVYGRKFVSGIQICNSSTANTKTVGSADCWFDVRYV